MRIAVYHNLPSGGGKRALYEMARRFACSHSVEAYSLSCAEHDFADLRPYCSRHVVYPFRPLPLLRRPAGRLNQGIRTVDLQRLAGLERRIAKQIDAANYDVVFVHQCRYAHAPALLRFLKTPTVYYSQEPPRLLYEPQALRPYNQYSRLQMAGNLVDPLPGLYRRVYMRQDKASIMAATRVLVNSDYSRENLYRTYGIVGRVCYLGIDGELFRPLGLARQQFLISVGSITPSKGFDFLLHSLAHVPPEARLPLMLVGNAVFPPEHRYLEQLAQALNVNMSVRVLVSDEELVTLYNRANLTLYAPILEPFGFVPLESMACGTPVVGVREAGVRESVCHGQTGMLVERDPGEFARVVQALLADTERQAQLSGHARASVETRWTWSNCVRRVERHLGEVADSRVH